MRYDIYGSLVDGEIEHKISKDVVKYMFSDEEIKKMCNVDGEEIISGDWKYWAEEAMNYKDGISVQEFEMEIREELYQCLCGYKMFVFTDFALKVKTTCRNCKKELKKLEVKDETR